MAGARFCFDGMKTVVIKIGSGTLLTKRGRVDEFRLAHVAEQVEKIRRSGIGVVLIVSGAVACGGRYLGKTEHSGAARQVAAGIGQVEVISALHRSFLQKGLTIAQVLLTPYALDAGQKGKIATVLSEYAQSGVVAIINENDVVELNGFGGNDLLAAEIATLVDASQVLILSQKNRSPHGIGGRETKHVALERLKRAGIPAGIVNGKHKNVILENIV